MITATPADIEQMKRVENELAAVLVKYRGTTEAAVLAFALVRLARTMLHRYGDQAQTDFRRACIDFLNERSTPRDDPAANLLLM